LNKIKLKLRSGKANLILYLDKHYCIRMYIYEEILFQTFLTLALVENEWSLYRNQVLCPGGDFSVSTDRRLNGLQRWT
jgi:hypothetical protein